MVLVAQPKQRTTIQHKKRTGTHHKHSASYRKPYWPYLPLIAIVGVGLILSTIWSHKPQVLGLSTDLSANSMLAETNEQRSTHGETSLTLNRQLMNAAQAKANDMASENFWSHITPSGQTPWSFMTAAGYNYQLAGENLAYGFSSSSQVTNAWMNSPTHRANILNAQYQNVGFGVAQSSDYQGTGPETIIVAMYAEPVTITTASAHNDTGAVSSTVGVTSPARNSTVQPLPQNVSRIQSLTGNQAPWALFTISAITTVLIVWFIIRHGLFWRRVLVKSEAFVEQHRILDVIIVSAIMLGYILTRTAGVIR